MRKKLKEYSRRFLSVLLCISIFCVFVISPVSATSTEPFLPLDDVLALQESDSFWYYPNSNSVEVSFYYPNQVCYVDGILWSNAPISNVHYGSNYTVVPLGNNFYRFFGSDNYAIDKVKLLISSDSTINYLQIVSLSVSSTNLTSSDLPYQVTGYSHFDRFDSPVINGYYDLPYDPSVLASNGFTFDFSIFVSPSDFRAYDYIFVRFNLNNVSLNSVLPRIGDYIVPSSLTTSNTSFPYNDEFTSNTVLYYTNHYGLSLNVSGLISSDSSHYLYIHVSGSGGSVPANYAAFGTVMYVTGFVKPPVIEVDVYWHKKLFNLIKSGLNNISSKLDNIFTVLRRDPDGNNSSINSAVQTQEEINVSVNNQLVGAVQDWNTNIEVVETGYDLAVTKTTPALLWLSSLADGIFNGMGWFGNVYFLVGLISVLMLLLSKSGLASKIGSISRRRGD